MEKEERPEIEIEEKKTPDNDNQENNLENCLKEKSRLENELNQLREKLTKTEEAAKKLSVLYQNIQKEFEDYKARMRKEKEEAKEEGALRLAKGIMEIVDNFEKALESSKNATDLNAILKGIQMIHYQLYKFLQDQGIEKIDTDAGFNPMEHEAIETILSTEHKPNEIIKVVQTGYKFKGKTIRPAKVIVAIPPEDREEIT